MHLILQAWEALGKLGFFFSFAAGEKPDCSAEAEHACLQDSYSIRREGEQKGGKGDPDKIKVRSGKEKRR